LGSDVLGSLDRADNPEAAEWTVIAAAKAPCEAVSDVMVAVITRIG
jgi:hypothetical protein